MKISVRRRILSSYAKVITDCMCAIVSLTGIADVYANFVVMRPDFVKRCHPIVEVNALL